MYGFCGPEKTFDRVPGKVFEWSMRKNRTTEVLVRSVLSLNEGAKTRIRVDSQVSHEFKVKVGMHQGSMLSPFFFALVVGVVTEFAREGALSELLYVDDLILMSEATDGLRNKFMKWNEAFESKGLKDNLGKSKVMVIGGITEDGISSGYVDPYGVCCLRVKANSVLCLQCCKRIHSRCTVTPKLRRNVSC